MLKGGETMRRGTTPTLVIKISGIEVSALSDIYITLTQGSSFSLTKTGTELTLDETNNKISVTLTEEETLLMNAKVTLNVQMRAVTDNDKVIASNIKQLNVSTILMEEVIG